jgi:hypothetical protein
MTWRELSADRRRERLLEIFQKALGESGDARHHRWKEKLDPWDMTPLMEPLCMHLLDDASLEAKLAEEAETYKEWAVLDAIEEKKLARDEKLRVRVIKEIEALEASDPALFAVPDAELPAMLHSRIEMFSLYCQRRRETAGALDALGLIRYSLGQPLFDKAPPAKISTRKIRRYLLADVTRDILNIVAERCGHKPLKAFGTATAATAGPLIKITQTLLHELWPGDPEILDETLLQNLEEIAALRAGKARNKRRRIPT